MVRRFTILIGLLALLAMPFASTATATHVTGEFGLGNPRCEGTKIEPVTGGTHSLVGGGHVVITIVNTSAGPTFDWDTQGTATVGLVTVKGGPNHMNYIYSPVATSDTGLHAPFNTNSGKWYGLSHLCFESEKKVPDSDPKK